MPTLRINSRIQAFQDDNVAEPRKNFVDYQVFAGHLPVKELVSDSKVVDAGDTLTLVNVSTISGIAVGALYSLQAHPSKTGRYQIRYTGGAVANPLLSLGTGLLTPANTYAIALNSDGSINLSDTSVTPVNFGTLVARGDNIYIAGSQFGDTGPFATSNQGFWTVVRWAAVGANPGAMLVLKRVNPVDSIGVAETQTATAALNVQKVSPAVAVLLTGASPYAGVWSVQESASGWVSIDSANVLPDLSGVTLTALTIVPESFVGYARVEVDNMAVVSVKSGDFTQGQQVLRPVKCMDSLSPPIGGWCENYGFLTGLTVQNVSDMPIRANIVLAYVIE